MLLFLICSNILPQFMGNANLTAGLLMVTPNIEVLKTLRTKLKQTQRQVEDATGISSPRLSLYESGNAAPLSHLKLLATLYEVPVVVLMHPNDADLIRAMNQELHVLVPPRNGG